LSGRRNDNPGWSHEDFDNKNNHSIVIRLDFGKASFLFTGDLEKPAIATERSRASLSKALYAAGIDPNLYFVHHTWRKRKGLAANI
jgi:hypothetical protein